MRFLALDWGTVRIGASVSDPDGKIAFPLDRFIDPSNAIDEIKKIVDELKVDKILVGMPKSLTGQETPSSGAVKEFIAKLQEKVATEFEILDERFSSVAAGKSLTQDGVSQKDQRAIKDNIAAQIMLQQYLDAKVISNK